MYLGQFFCIYARYKVCDLPSHASDVTFAEKTLNLLKYILSRLALHYAFGSVDEEILPNQENRDFFLEKCYSYLIFYL